MKTQGRTVTACISLAVVASALVLGLRSFAQSSGNEINLPNYQKLKAPYNEDGDLWEKDILKKHAKKYCITHSKKDGTKKTHCPKAQTSSSQSSIIPVANSSAPVPIGDKPSGVNVTQQIIGASPPDTQAILDTFDNG